MDDDTRFAAALISRVRDDSIIICDTLAEGTMRGPQGARWRQRLQTPESRDLLRELIPDIVDTVLGELLLAVDQGQLPLAWQREDGSFAPLEQFGGGEMMGWYASGEWIARFSSQRFTDDLPHY